MTTPTAEHVIHGNVQHSYSGAWREYLEGLDETLEQVDRCLSEAREVQEVCTDEWCEATDRLLDDLNHVLFSIHEPRWASAADTERIKALRRRARNLYTRFESMMGEEARV